MCSLCFYRVIGHSGKFGRTRKSCENPSFSARVPTTSLVLPSFLFQFDVRTPVLPVRSPFQEAGEREKTRGKKGLRLSPTIREP